MQAVWLDGLVSGREAAEEVLLLGLFAPGFLLGGVKKEPGGLGEFLLWLCGMSLLLTAICAAVLGCFAAEITERLSLIFFRSLERVKALVVSLWLFPDFLLCSLTLFSAQHCLRLALGTSPAYRGERAADMARGRWLTWLGAAFSIGAGLLLAPDAARLTLWSERVIPIGQATAALSVSIIYMVGKGKHRL